MVPTSRMRFGCPSGPSPLGGTHARRAHQVPGWARFALPTLLIRSIFIESSTSRYHTLALQPKHIKHRSVALFLEFRRVDQGALAQRARSRGDRHILLAVDLEAHGRRREAGADIHLPQLL